MSKKEDVQRLPAEQLFQDEIDALIKAEKNPIPTGWKMSPKSVLTYICGGKVGKKNIIPKYIGNKRLVEIAISTLVTDRALLLIHYLIYLAILDIKLLLIFEVFYNFLIILQFDFLNLLLI